METPPMNTDRKESKEAIALPQEVATAVGTLHTAGFEAYAVGGCVRDLLIGRTPDDWDVTTNATPAQIKKVFPKSFYENKFLTVTAQTASEDPTLKEIEITTFRKEGRYEDKRHPSEVTATKTLEEDLSRRDFTINAMAFDATTEGVTKIIDPFGGQNDLREGLIRAVGDPKERFEEDALRMLRAIRFAAKLELAIEPKTYAALKEKASSINVISKERVRDELVEIISGQNAKLALEMMHDSGLMQHIVPELEEGIGIEQRGPHKYEVWEHNLRALAYAEAEGWSPRVRLAALFHDVAKPRTRERRGGIWTFYGHDVVGAKMAHAILRRLKFPRQEIEAISKLVRWHLFNYKVRRDDQYYKDLSALGEQPKDIEDSEADVQETTDAAIRRLIANVGEGLIYDLIKVRVCDRIATGVPKAVPYRLRHFQFRVEKILREHEAIHVNMLTIRGEDVMRILDIPPGPRVGHVLNALLEEVIDEPKKNKKDYLEARVQEIGALSDEELKRLREHAEEKMETIESEREAEMKKKYHVR